MGPSGFSTTRRNRARSSFLRAFTQGKDWRLLPRRRSLLFRHPSYRTADSPLSALLNILTTLLLGCCQGLRDNSSTFGSWVSGPNPKQESPPGPVVSSGSSSQVGSCVCKDRLPQQNLRTN